MAGGSGGSGPLDRRLTALTDDVRAAEAATQRRRQQALHRSAAAEGTVAGVLVDLGERQTPVALATGPGRTIRGLVRVVGADFVVVDDSAGQRVLVALAALTTITPAPAAAATAGVRVHQPQQDLASALADLAEVPRPVVVRTAAQDTVSGTLTGTGVDVVTVRSSDGRLRYVTLSAIAEVLLP